MRSSLPSQLYELLKAGLPDNWNTVHIPQDLEINSEYRKHVHKLLEELENIAPANFAIRFFDNFLSQPNLVLSDQQKALIVFGRILATEHRYHEAVDKFQKALVLSYEPDATEPSDLVMNYLGVVFSMMGELQKALEAHTKSLEIIATSENEERKAIYYNNLGTVQKDIGLTREAAESFKKALPIMQKLDRPEFLASLYVNIGTVYSKLKRYKDSLNFQHEALKIHRGNGNKKEECNALTNIGNILRDMDEYSEASKIIKEALDIAKDSNFKFQHAVNLYNLGLLQKKVSELDKAKESFLESAMISEAIDDKEGIWRAYLEIGDLFRESSDFNSAHKYLKQAEKVFESMRKDLKADRDRVAFLSNQKELMEKIVFLELERQSPNLWGLVQNAKSRSLRELLLGDIHDGNEFDDEWSESKAKSLYDDGKLGISDCLIDFFAGPDGFIRFVYHPHFGLKTSVKKIARTKINNEIDKIYEEIKYLETIAPDMARDGYALSSESIWYKPYENLHFLLFSDIMDELKPYDQLIINPHGALHRLPFSALRASGEPIVRNHSIVISPSLPLLSWQLASPVNFDSGYKLFMTSTDESVTMTKEEGRQLSQISGDGILVEISDSIMVYTPSSFKGDLELVLSLEDGEKFKGNLAKMFDELSLFHFAGHGVFEADDPMKSYLKITPDIRISSDEFYRGDFHGGNMKLITLSACETGKSQVIEGDELWGFSRALFGSGARSLLLSMWKVEDQSAHDLMLEFYVNLFQNDLTLGQSLSCAQNRILETHQDIHPFFWAPYVLYGSP